MNGYGRIAREMVHEWESLGYTVTGYDMYTSHRFRKIDLYLWTTVIEVDLPLMRSNLCCRCFQTAFSVCMCCRNVKLCYSFLLTKLND